VGKASRSDPLYAQRDQPVAIRVSDLLAAMTVDEKLAQLGSCWFHELQEDQVPSPVKLRAQLDNGIGQITRVGGGSTLAPTDVARAGNAIQRFLVEETRLGIPAILHEESCVGYMGLGGTIFPQMIGIASSWTPSLARSIAENIRRQLLAVGARQTLAPVLDVARDPRWGRTEETFGEDPLLVAQFGMALVDGLQGADPAAGVIATGKHFVGHSASSGGRNCAPAELGPRTLWDVYLAPFQAAIQEVGLRSIMNAYPALDGDLVGASHALLTDVLRGRLGFEGLVVSDYESISMIHTLFGVAPDLEAAAVIALRAGIDIELPTRVCYGEPLRAALAAGVADIEEVDAAVRRVLRAKFDLGLFENPYVDEAAVGSAFETPDQRHLALEAARQSIILLKNEMDLLPLQDPGTLAVIGPNADEPRHLLGDYSYPSMLELMRYAPLPRMVFFHDVDEDHLRAHAVKVPSVLDGIREAAGHRTRVIWAPGCGVSDNDRSGLDEAVAVARRADMVVLVLGDRSGLVPSCTSGETRDRVELGLPGVQEDLARAIVAVGKPVAAVLINGRPVGSPWLQENVPAILEAWLPGEEGARAIAEVLFGKVNPGGKLPVTVPRSAGQLPLHYSLKPTGARSHWYGDYVESPSSPLYPFGHGLSYTSFEYSDLQVSPEAAGSGEVIEVRLTVTNRGARAGDEVVQLYVHDEYASVPRPAKELKGFCRVSLAPGAGRRVVFRLPVDAMAFTNGSLDFVVEPGAIQLLVGSSSEDIRLEGRFEIVGADSAAVAKRIFGCPVDIEPVG
jgi:beta-glucosidase